MKKLFIEHSHESAKQVTKTYSTSFYAGVRLLHSSIQQDIHNIYGFVRFADEIVDTFHEFDKAELLEEFKSDTYKAIERGISLNPILNAFQETVNKYAIQRELIDQFLHSMAMDLKPIEYSEDKYKEYILGSAEVVGLMCLKIFVYGDEEQYKELKPYAMKLGSAFQKINFLRDLKADFYELGRIYFPGVDCAKLSLEDKLAIENEIEIEFNEALEGIKKLPKRARLGVYMSYKYYRSLLKKIKAKTLQDLMNERIRVSNNEKMVVFAKSYLRNSLNVL